MKDELQFLNYTVRTVNDVLMAEDIIDGPDCICSDLSSHNVCIFFAKEPNEVPQIIYSVKQTVFFCRQSTSFLYIFK